MQQSQQQVGQRWGVVELDVLVALDGAGTTTKHHGRQRVVIVVVAVRHVGAVQQYGVVEQRIFAIRNFCQLVHEARNHRAVPGLQLRQFGEVGLGIVVMRQRMECIRNADVGIGLVADFGRHHERHHAGHVGLVGQRDHVEHQIDTFIEIGNAHRQLRQFVTRHVALLQVLHPAFNFAHAVEIVVEHRNIGRTKSAFERAGFFPHHVEQALVVIGDQRPLLVVAAFTKQFGEEFL